MSLDGVYSVLPTGFSDSAALDRPSQRPVLDLLIRHGADGRMGPGTSGEAARLDCQERAPRFETVISRASGRGRVVACSTPDGTRASMLYSRPAKELGSAAVAVRSSGTARRHSDDAVRHYKALASSAPCPGAGGEKPAFDHVLTWVTTQKGFEWISG